MKLAAQTKALYNYDPGSTTFQAPPEMADKELIKIRLVYK